jgi:hypothetical protein
MLAVASVQVRRTVLPVVHANDDAVKPADLGHEIVLGSTSHGVACASGGVVLNAVRRGE